MKTKAELSQHVYAVISLVKKNLSDSPRSAAAALHRTQGYVTGIVEALNLDPEQEWLTSVERTIENAISDIEKPHRGGPLLP